MNAQEIQKKLDEYYGWATPEQIVKEFEDLGVEFVELPTVKINQDKITFYNLLRSNGTTKVTMDRAEAALYYIELHKFLTDELNTATTTDP